MALRHGDPPVRDDRVLAGTRILAYAIVPFLVLGFALFASLLGVATVLHWPLFDHRRVAAARAAGEFTGGALTTLFGTGFTAVTLAAAALYARLRRTAVR